MDQDDSFTSRSLSPLKFNVRAPNQHILPPPYLLIASRPQRRPLPLPLQLSSPLLPCFVLHPSCGAINLQCRLIFHYPVLSLPPGLVLLKDGSDFEQMLFESLRTQWSMEAIIPFVAYKVDVCAGDRGKRAVAKLEIADVVLDKGNALADCLDAVSVYRVGHFWVEVNLRGIGIEESGSVATVG